MNTVFGDTGALGTGTGGSGGKNAMYQGMSIAFKHFKYGLASPAGLAALGEGYKAAFATGAASAYAALGAELNAKSSIYFPFKLEEFNPTIRNMTIYPEARIWK